jgi:hypothetical protein
MAERLTLLVFPLFSIVFTALLLYGSPRFRVPFDPQVNVSRRGAKSQRKSEDIE